MEIPPNETHQPPLAEPTLGEMVRNEQVEDREQEIKRDFNAPLGGIFLISWIIVILIFIGILVLLSNFHPMW